MDNGTVPMGAALAQRPFTTKGTVNLCKSSSLLGAEASMSSD